MPEASTLSTTLLFASSAWAGGGIFVGTWLARSRARAERVWIAPALVCAWLALTMWIGMTGIADNFEALPPGLFFVLFPCAILAVLAARSHTGTLMVAHIPMAYLLLFQGFRVPVEIMLWSLAQDGVIGARLTFEGYNFDIVSGILGLALGGALLWRRLPGWLLWTYNVLGLLLLANVVVTAVLSLPTSFRVFVDDPPVSLVARAPFIWLPTVLVCSALFGHVLLWRALRSART